MQLNFIPQKKYGLIGISGHEETKSEELMVSLQVMFRQLDDILDQGHSKLVFDLSNYEYINSSMISLFVLASTKTRDKKGWTRLIVPHENTRQILELIGMNKLSRLYDSEKELLRDLLISS